MPARVTVNPGDRFGRLVVIEEVERVASGTRPSGKPIMTRRMRCECECGSLSVYRLASLTTGASRGCVTCRNAGNRKIGIKHGLADTPPHRVWRSMIGRCTTASHGSYHNYGGRGIAVCDRWRFGEAGQHPFECWLADMGERPTPKHQLDRIDNDGHYEPANCRWATKAVQANNTRANRRVVVAGSSLTLAQAARAANTDYDSFRYAVLFRGDDPDDFIAKHRP